MGRAVNAFLNFGGSRVRPEVRLVKLVQATGILLQMTIVYWTIQKRSAQGNESPFSVVNWRASKSA